MKNNFKNKKNIACPSKHWHSRGFMMVEVLIVASIITASVLACMGVAQKAISLSQYSVHTAEASFLLEEGAEAVRILRDNSWSNILNLQSNKVYALDFAGSTWNVSEIQPVQGQDVNISESARAYNSNFFRVFRVLSVNRDTNGDIVHSGGTLDTGTKEIDITVSWKNGGNTVSKTLPFYIMNIFNE